MMVLACELAREKESAVDALHVIEVPMQLPLDARLSGERANGKAVLERATAIADQFGVKANPILVVARQAGKAIVETAEERRSEVIVLGSRRRRQPGSRRFGKTVDYVLEHAPMEVIHNLVPMDYPVADALILPPGQKERVVEPAEPAAPEEDPAGEGSDKGDPSR
jgi:nucleotide-binding universal stress UspA family protein